MPTTTDDRPETTPPANGRPAQGPGPLLLSQPAAQRYLGISRSAWYRLRAAGKLPAPVSVPGAGTGPMWRRRDLEKFVERLRPARA
jgi:predicted DNA-binding transcriptional regulator AlpA